ncbi:MAG: hypothetical protein ACREX6_09820 [Casimicrobiaceae bacterium]
MAARDSRPIPDPILPGARQPSIPVLDASYLPVEEDWAVLEALHGSNDNFDPDDDRYAVFGVITGHFD